MAYRVPKCVLLTFVSFLTLIAASCLSAAEDAGTKKRIAALLPAISADHSWVAAFDGESYLFNPGAGVDRAPFLSNVYKAFGFSQDARYFLYLRANGKLPSFRLHRYDLINGNDQQIADRVHFAFWSPINHDIAFVTAENATNFNLYLYNASTDRTDLIASGSLEPNTVEWTKDGSALVYAEMQARSTDAVHTGDFRSTVQRYDIRSGTTARLVSSQRVRSGNDSTRTVGTLAGSDAEEMRNVYDTDSGIGRRSASGSVYTSTGDGIVVREFTASGVSYKLISPQGDTLQSTAFANGYLLPFSGSAYMVQGGSMYSSGACDGSVCLANAHRLALGYALDWQQTPEDGQGNRHVLAVADGTVAATWNTVTCNSVTTTCKIGWDNYSSSCNDPNDGAGNYVAIAHLDGSYSFYGHLRSGSVRVTAGQAVTKGDYLADQGHSGSAGSPTAYLTCGDHLHFQRQNSPAVWAQSIPTDFETPCVLTCMSSYLSNNVENNTAAATALTVLLTPSTIVGGGTTQGNKIVLPNAAPAGGAAVSLNSSDPSVASVPATVTVPAGSTSATFPVTAAVPGAGATAIITAAYNDQTATAALTVNPVGVAAVLLSATSVVGGTAMNGNQITLLGPAPVDLTVALASSSPVLTVPASLFIPAGATVAKFNAQTALVTASVRPTVTATLSGVSRSQQVSVTTLLSGLSVSATSVTGGNAITGNRVVLLGLAPSGGVDIALASSNPAVIPIPSSITVPAGTRFSAYFTLSTAAVSTATSVTLSASYAGATATTVIKVQPGTSALNAVTLTPAVVMGGATVTAAVSLTAAAAANVVATLTTTDATVAPVPASVTIPAGQTSVSFSIPAAVVSSSKTVTIGATAGGITKTAVLTVNALDISSVNLSSTIVAGGQTTTANKVNLTGPATAGPATVALSSSNSAVASVPASVTIPAGAAFQTFDISTAAVAVQTPVTITATYNGKTAQAVLTVNPRSPSLTSVSPGVGAPGSAVNVTLTGTNFVIPSTVSAGAGITVSNVSVISSTQITATFAISSTAVAGNNVVTVSTGFGTSNTVPFTIAGYAAIVRGSFNSTAPVNVSSASMPLNVPATSNVMVVAVAYYQKLATVSAVTAGGAPLVRLRRDNNPSYHATTELWYLAGPPSGVVTINVTLTAASGTLTPLQVAAVTYSGVDTVNPVEAQRGSVVTGTHTSHQDSVTTLTPGAMVVDVLTTALATLPVPNAGQTAIVNRLDSGSTVTVTERGLVPVPGTNVMGYTFPSTSPATAHSVLVLKPAAVP